MNSENESEHESGSESESGSENNYFDEDEITRAKVTIEEMMEYRNYDIRNTLVYDDDDIIFLKPKEITFVSFQHDIGDVKFKNNFMSKNDNGKETGILKSKQRILEKLEKNNIDSNVWIFVVKRAHPGIFDIIRKHKEVNPTIFIQIFEIKSLLFNVSNNILVPTHIRMNREEKEFYDNFLKSFNIPSMRNIPKILLNDPIAKFIGLREGEICKIERTYCTTYRLCVHKNEKMMRFSSTY